MTERLSDYTKHQLTDLRSCDYARWVAASVEAGAAGPVATAARFLDRWPTAISHTIVKDFALHVQTVDLAGKAAVAPGSTTDAAWAGPLAAPPEFVEAFLTIARPREVVNQLAGVLRVPPNTPVPIWNPNSPSSATWVAEGAIKPMAQFAFTSATLVPSKVQMGCAVTRELLAFGGATADRALRDVLAFQVTTGVNEEFLVPTRAPIARERPGSITNAGTVVTSQNDAPKDAAAVLAALMAARPTATPALILDPTAAMALIATGQHRDLTFEGGRAFGAQTIVSAAAGKTIAALDVTALLLWDEGIGIDASKYASIVLDTAPPTGATQVVVSAFQANLIALRAERDIAWKLTAATACHYATRA